MGGDTPPVFDGQTLEARESSLVLIQAVTVVPNQVDMLIGRAYMFPQHHSKEFHWGTMSGNHITSLTHRLWTWLLVLGPLATGTGGSQKVGNMCGSVFRANNFTAAYYESLGGAGAEAACHRSIAAAAIPTWILIVLGIVLALAAVIIRTVSNDGPIAVTGSSGPRRWRPRRPGPP
ncbi:MAG: hypothetical protein ABWX72_01785 [Arthrobacter sp.]